MSYHSDRHLDTRHSLLGFHLLGSFLLSTYCIPDPERGSWDHGLFPELWSISRAVSQQRRRHPFSHVLLQAPLSHLSLVGQEHPERGWLMALRQEVFYQTEDMVPVGELER